MILRRYGTSFHSVTPNFNPSAMTEVGFQRDHEHSVGVEEFEGAYVSVGDPVEIGAEANGEVQKDVEAKVLQIMEEALLAKANDLSEGQVLLILNGKDDQPKTRERRENVIVDGENRFHFRWWVEPPLRVQVFKTASGS